MLTWWTMPVSGGTTRKLRNAGLSPAQEHVALAIAVVLEIGVQRQRVGRAEVIDLHRVIDHELDRLQRIDLLRIAAERHDAVAHRRQIDDARHAGEVLQQDPRRHERHFLLADASSGSHDASASMSAALTNASSSRRSRFSSRIFSEYGSVATPGNRFSSAGRL